MFSKPVVAAALLASAVTAWDPQNHGPLHGHPGPHPCKTTSTVIVTETATFGYWAAGGASTATGWAAGAASTATGWAPQATHTVTVSADGQGGWVTVSSDGHGGWATVAPGSTSTASAGYGGHGGYTGSATTTASAVGGSGGYGGHSGSTTSTASPSGPTTLCLTNSSATYLTNAYGQLLSAYTNATANAVLASDFTDTSDSINWLAGIPLGGYTFSSKAAFIAGQGTQPPIGFTVNSIMHSCTQVAFRWTATVGLKKFPAKGINMFTASNLNGTDAGWQIETMYSEFDVGAWEVDIGRTCSPQGANIAGSA